MQISPAQPSDAAALSALARAAKAHWGYPPEWLEWWQPVLTISPEFIAAHPTFVARADERLVGFAAIAVRRNTATLEHLWIDPGAIRRGIGTALFRRCEAAARQLGAAHLEIESDPHAELFYRRMGAARVGEIPANVNGVTRALPLLRKELHAT